MKDRKAWHAESTGLQRVGQDLVTEKKTTETVADFIFLGSKITVDDDCSH